MKKTEIKNMLAVFSIADKINGLQDEINDCIQEIEAIEKDIAE